MREPTNSYAKDGKCHNAAPGTYGHECGKPAAWLGRMYADSDKAYGFCDRCKRYGHEARKMAVWEPLATEATR